MNRAKLALSLLTLCLLQGCVTSVTMNATDLPDALVEKWPLTVAVRYDSSLRNFIHEEKLATGERYTIDLGPASQQMFASSFNDMFDSVIEIPANAARIPEVDLLIDASVSALEFVTPAQTVTKDYAVWIKYQVKVYNSQGQLQAEYPVSAYGKSSRGALMNNSRASLGVAAELALRDASVLLLTRFDIDAGLRGRQLPALNQLATRPVDTSPVPVATDVPPNTSDASSSEETADNAGNYL
ncbi:MAG: hypothetical protein AAF004_15560 [Pseudomonadota bacterium]